MCLREAYFRGACPVVAHRFPSDGAGTGKGEFACWRLCRDESGRQRGARDGTAGSGSAAGAVFFESAAWKRVVSAPACRAGQLGLRRPVR